MSGRTWMELAFFIILLGDVLMHPEGFVAVITSASSLYNGVVKTFEGM